MKIRILADDLTGALDTAAAFAGEVPVWLDRPGDAPGDAPVEVVATATRDVPVDTLEALLAPSVAWLRAADVSFKKVDSLLRGNTMAECAWLARACGAADVLLAPAYPQQGRVVVAGRALLRRDGEEPRPIIDTPLAQAFTDAWQRPAAGDAAPTLRVPDAIDDASLDAVASAALHDGARGWLWCGSAGLAHALARVIGRGASAPLAAWPPIGSLAAPPDVSPDVRVVSATRNPVLLGQWRRVLAQLPSRRREPAIGDMDFIAGAIRGMHLAPSTPLAADAAAAHLAQSCRALVDAAPAPSLLVVVGGDTLLALCRAANARRLIAGSSPRPGWGMATLVGGRWNGVRCLSRSGAFGDDADLLTLLRPWLSVGA